MSIDKYMKTQEDVELLELWMRTPPAQRPKEMPAQMVQHLERLSLANTWLIAHGGSKKKVWPMLLAHFKALGVRYSESTARRDVNDAMHLFQTLSRKDTRWITGFQIDNLLERLDSCSRSGKDREYAMLSMVLDKFLERADKYMREDEELLNSPVPILAVVAPEEVGITPDPNIHEKIAKWKERRAQIQRGHDPKNVDDADYEEQPE